MAQSFAGADMREVLPHIDMPTLLLTIGTCGRR